MRLIHFTASKVWRGHEQKIIYLYEEFQEKKYTKEQWIVCPIDSEIYQIAKEKNFNVIPFQFKSEYDIFFANKFKKIVTACKANLIFMHNSQAQTLAVLSAFLFNLKVPMVLCRTLIKKIDTNFLRKWKYNYPQIKKIICISQPVVDLLVPAIKDPSRLSIVGAMTDAKLFQAKNATTNLRNEFSIPEDYKIIGYIAAFVAVKDHRTWIHSIELLKKKGIKAKYILIGTGSMEPEMQQLVAEKGMQDDVIFAGFRKNIPEILPEFDLLLFTSKNEAVGSTILEAYASHVPVVAANAGGIPEVVLDGTTGLLASVSNPQDFAEKAEQMLTDASFRNKCIENGYTFLMEHYTKEIVSKKMFDELNAVYLDSKNN